MAAKVLLLLGLHLRQTIAYPQTPGAVLDPRLSAAVACDDGTEFPFFEVEDAPPVPQTRDPGFGRPPLTSSRLRLRTSGPTEITLTALGEGSFGSGAVLR